MAEKYLTYDGLDYFWGKLKDQFDNKVDKVSGKGLSTNDYTTTEKNKLASIARDAQVNVIETVQVNGSPLTPSAKTVNIDLSTYALKSDITAVLKYKGTKATVAELPPTDNTVGDVWFVTENSTEHAWDGSKWEVLGGSTDLSSYLTKSEAGNVYLTKTEAGTTYLKITDAAGTYVTSEGLEESLAELLTSIGQTYLTQANADNTYVTKTSAESTYVKKTDIVAITNQEIDTIMAS